MAKKKLYWTIPRYKINREYTFDWSSADTNDWTKVNATITNWVFVNTDRWYQKQQLNWWASTTFTYSSVTYVDSYIWIKASWVWTFNKNNAKVTATALNWVNWESYVWLRFVSSALTTSEEQSLYQEGIRMIWAWSDWIMSSAIAYYDFNWDASDIIWWNNGTVSWATLTQDRFGIANRAYNFTWNTLDKIETGTWLWIALTNWYINLQIKPGLIPTWSDFWEILWVLNSSAQYIIWLMIYQQKWYVTYWVWWANWVLHPTTPIPVLWTDYNVTLVWTPTSITIYINWVQIATWWTWTFAWTIDRIRFWYWKYVWKIEYWILWNKNLSADEVKELYNLSSKKYLYQFKKQLSSNLKDWLVFWWSWDTSWSSYLDASWNWNNWTLVNSPTISRIWQHKQTSFNWSNQRVSFTSNIVWSWTVVSFSLWVKNWLSSQTTDTTIISNQLDSSWLRWFVLAQRPSAWNSWNVFYWDANNNWRWINENLIPLTVWKYEHIAWVINWSTITLYKNWTLFSSATYATPISLTSAWLFSIWAYHNNWTPNRWFNWVIENPMIWNRVLSPLEIQQLYYSQFIS